MDLQTKRTPVVFICHSIGGLILKKVGPEAYTLRNHGSNRNQALCIARQHHYSYREVIDVIFGIVFLGVPHGSARGSNHAVELDNILRSRPRKADGFSVVTSDQDDYLELCQHFDDASLRARMLVAYETHETAYPRRLRKGFWKRRSGIVRYVFSTLASEGQ